MYILAKNLLKIILKQFQNMITFPKSTKKFSLPCLPEDFATLLEEDNQVFHHCPPGSAKSKTILLPFFVFFFSPPDS